MRPKEKVTYHRSSGLPGLESCRVRDSRHRFPNHFHDDLYGIGLMEHGASYCFGPDQRDAVVESGKVTLLNPGQVHSGVPVDDRRLSYTMCYINTAAMQEIAFSLELSNDDLPEFIHPITRDRKLIRLFQRLVHYMVHAGDPLAAESAMVTALGYLIRYHSRISGNGIRNGYRKHPVKKACELLASGLDQKLTLAEVAGEVGLSRYHFLRVFKKETGLSPHLYRTLKRVEAAKVFLRQGRPPIEVALDTGFADQSHFTNTFHRYFGATPCQYLISS